MENSDQLIEKMKHLNIKPKPGWHYTFKSVFYWFLFVISVLLGALSFSIVLFTVQQIDFDLISHMSHSKVEFLLGLMPFFWIISIIIFLAVAMIGIKNSKKGYKYSFASLSAYTASFSILVGIIFFIGGGAEWLENAFSVRAGLVESVQSKKVNVWSMPENGRLAGTIMETNDTYIQLSDFKNNTWKIDIEKAHIPPSVLMVEGEKIKIIGEITSEYTFHAKEIRPWGVGEGGQQLKRKYR